MKKPLSLLLALAILPLAALAANTSASVASVKGSATATIREEKKPVSAGMLLSAGTVIETELASELTIALPSGGKIVLGPSTRIRIRTFEQANDPSLYSLEIILTRGRITGDASQGSAASNFVIRTTVSTSSVAGSVFAADFAPSGASGGAMTLSALSGLPTVTPRGGISPSPVQPGYATSISGSGTGAAITQTTQITSLNESQIRAILGGISSLANLPGETIETTTGTPPGGATTSGNVPNILLITPILQISPDGQGVLTR